MFDVFALHARVFAVDKFKRACLNGKNNFEGALQVVADRVRLAVRFEGRVQGVGFRYTVLELAQGRALSGFVRNEWDGTVLLEVEGERPDVDLLLCDIYRSRLGRYIQHERRTARVPTGAEGKVEIRY